MFVRLSRKRDEIRVLASVVPRPLKNSSVRLPRNSCNAVCVKPSLASNPLESSRIRITNTVPPDWIASIEHGTFKVVTTANRLGRLPEIALMVGRREAGRVCCNHSNPPQVALVDHTTVRVSSTANARQIFDIDCQDERKARMIALTIEQCLRSAFERVIEGRDRSSRSTQDFVSASSNEY